MCISYKETYGLDIRITRCCNNYGPNQHSEKLIPTIINSLKDGKKIPVYGEGNNIREWIHVYDHNLAVWTVATSAKAKAGIYNIGSGIEMTNLEMVDILCNIFSKDMDDCVKFVEDRLGHDFRYSIDSTKLRDELIWEPLYNDIEGELEAYVEYYLNNDR
jgi:dTDP-glucose 4,6-dehydratase